MAVRSRKAQMLSVGTEVFSMAVGDKPAFIGEVTGYCQGSYHVRDNADGSGWHRSPLEVKPVGPLGSQKGAPDA